MVKSARFWFKHLHSIARFAGPAMLDQTIVSGLNFLVGIYLAYALGMEAFGQFSLILVITFFCLEMQRAFVLAPMMTFTAKKNQEGYTQSLVVMMAASAVAMAMLCSSFIKISGHFFPMWGISEYAAPVTFLIVSRAAQEFLRRFLFIHGQAARALIIDIAVSLLIVAGLFALNMRDQMDVRNVLLLHAVAYAVGYAMGFSTVHTRQPWPSRGVILEHLKKHWIFGRWLIAGVIATYASSNLLLMTGAAQLGSQAAGLIKTAQYLMGGMIVLFQGMENIIPYRMAQLTEQTPHELKAFLLRVLAGMMAFCAVHGLVIYLFIDRISAWIAPGREHDMRPIAIANIFFTGFLVVTYCLQYLLRALEHTKPIFWANTVTAMFSLLCGGYFIGTFGVIGITYGLFVIQIIVQIICFYSVRHFWFAKK